MEKEQPSRKWNFAETNCFCEILMETLEKKGVNKDSSSRVFDCIIDEFKEGLENGQMKGKKIENLITKKKETKLVVKIETFLQKTL